MSRKSKSTKIKKEKNTIIKDWAGNICFFGKSFHDFDDAEEFLTKKLGNDYDTDRGEYYIIDED